MRVRLINEPIKDEFVKFCRPILHRDREIDRLFQIRTKKKERRIVKDKKRKEGRTEQPSEEEEGSKSKSSKMDERQVGFNYSGNNTGLASHCLPGRVFLVWDPVSRYAAIFRSP